MAAKARPTGVPAKSATAPTPEALQRWERDVEAIHESIRLMLANRLAEADQRLEDAAREVAARTIDFQGGDHDMRGGFAFVGALMGLMNGLATMENNQLDTVLQRVWAADELLAADGDWAGKTVLRGLCLLVAGLVQILQGSAAKGVWHILRSWLYLRSLESEGLNFEGHERSCVRSTALLALGVFNLFVSVLPPQAMRTAGWITGFKGGRETALEQLRLCWEEGGIQAPFAGLALIGVAVDVSSFLGEFRSERDQRQKDARRILDWAREHYPDAFFFDGLEAGYLAEQRDLDGAVAKLEHVRSVVQNLPAFLFLVHVRLGTLCAAKFDWVRAGESFQAAVDVHREVGRRALCPALSLVAHLCFFQAGDQERAARMLELCLSYSAEKKKWSPIDRIALRNAEVARLSALAAIGADASPSPEGAEPPTPAADGGPPAWRPRMLLFQRICVIYRAVNFMQAKQVEVFIDLVRQETEACGEDVTGRCLGLFIQAEAMRQCENWDEALRLAGDCAALASQLPREGRKTGALQYSQLVAAYAHYAKGNPGAAKEALKRLDSLGSDFMFQRQVEFKATQLKKLVGAEFQDSYTEVSVQARSRARLVLDVPAGTRTVEWDWLLEEFSVNYAARLYTASDKASVELQKVEQYQATSGPFVGELQVPKDGGQLEFVFDNSFSLLRGKTIRFRLQPSGLELRREDRA